MDRVRPDTPMSRAAVVVNPTKLYDDERPRVGGPDASVRLESSPRHHHGFRATHANLSPADTRCPRGDCTKMPNWHTNPDHRVCGLGPSRIRMTVAGWDHPVVNQRHGRGH